MGKYRPIVILTGAGISAESGLKTFRGNNGLWENRRVEEIATPEAFINNKDLVYKFYNQRYQQLNDLNIKPNEAHFALKTLEENYPGKVTIITQNVDNLHERAGSKNIIHMHGELSKMRCIETGNVFSMIENLDSFSVCECCSKVGNLRPHIVWFGEMPLFLDDIDDLLSNCGLFLSIGTSGAVYPAAMFVQTVKYYIGNQAIEFNVERTSVSSNFDATILGPATIEVPRYVDNLLKEFC